MGPGVAFEIDLQFFDGSVPHFSSRIPNDDDQAIGNHHHPMPQFSPSSLLSETIPDPNCEIDELGEMVECGVHFSDSL